MAGTGLGSLVVTRKENEMTNTIPQVGGGYRQTPRLRRF